MAVVAAGSNGISTCEEASRTWSRPRFASRLDEAAKVADVSTLGGAPRTRPVIEGGVDGDIGTEAVIVTLVPWVATAPPGLRTKLDALPVGYTAGA